MNKKLLFWICLISLTIITACSRQDTPDVNPDLNVAQTVSWPTDAFFSGVPEYPKEVLDYTLISDYPNQGDSICFIYIANTEYSEFNEYISTLKSYGFNSDDKYTELPENEDELSSSIATWGADNDGIWVYCVWKTPSPSSSDNSEVSSGTTYQAVIQFSNYNPSER